MPVAINQRAFDQPILGYADANGESIHPESVRLAGGRAHALGYVVRFRMPLRRDLLGRRVKRLLLRFVRLPLLPREKSSETFLLPRQESGIAIFVPFGRRKLDHLHLPLEEPAAAAKSDERFAEFERATRVDAFAYGSRGWHSAG
jgi:hypothetical protein